MRERGAEFWTDDTSVLFTSFWGWTPETWGTVGWTGKRGRARRDNLLRQLTDPFITVCYVTSNKDFIAPDLKGKIAGFYLVSHETGDRDEFTHPSHFDRSPEKWRESLRGLRAFSYLPEHRLTVSQLNPKLLRRARSVAAMGEVLSNRREIELLRETPWIEVSCFQPGAPTPDFNDPIQGCGRVRAGPTNERGYVVSPATARLKQQLYVLRLYGGTDAYLGRPSKGRSIYKVGLSVSPELRRQGFQQSMPRGAFRWRVHLTTKHSGFETCPSFNAAVAGEDAMKAHLAECAEWLGGEFYLATEAEIEKAWRLGHAALRSFRGKT